MQLNLPAVKGAAIFNDSEGGNRFARSCTHKLLNKIAELFSCFLPSVMIVEFRSSTSVVSSVSTLIIQINKIIKKKNSIHRDLSHTSALHLASRVDCSGYENP